MFFKGATLGLVALFIAQAVAIDLSASNYIWTNDGKIESQQIGRRAFRRAAYPPRGKHAKSADILINVDDNYKLYVNEVLVASASNYQAAQLYHIPLQGNCNVFAIDAGNIGGPAGVVATIKIHYTDGSTETIVTDQSWRAFTSVPAGFENDKFPDSNWPAATVLTPFKSRPAFWATVTIPSDAASF